MELEHLHTTLEQSLSSTNDMTFLKNLNEFKLVNKELSIYNYLEKYQTELEDKYSYKNKCLKTIEHFKLKNESINNEVCELIKTLPFKNGNATFNIECIDTMLLECNKYKLDIDLNVRGMSDSLTFEKRSFKWKIKFLYLGYNMVGYKLLWFLFFSIKRKLNNYFG